MPTIDIRDFDYKDYLFKMRKYFFAVFEKEGTMIAKKIIESVQSEIIRHRNIATEQLLNSWDYDIHKLEGAVSIEVFSKAKYAMAVEHGTRAHFPPVNAIAKWIVAKRAYYGWDIADKDVESAAFAIARRISVKGTQGYGFFNTGTRKGIREANKILNNKEV